MKKQTLGNVDFYHGMRVYDPPATILANFWAEDLRYRKIVKLYGGKTGLGRVGIVHAHGCIDRGTWYCHDEFRNRWVEVQRVVRARDGKYAAILLSICNNNPDTGERGAIVTSTRSLVLAADGPHLNIPKLRGPMNTPSSLPAELTECSPLRVLREFTGRINLFFPRRGYIPSEALDDLIRELS